jgi:hypothetical protein
MSHCDPGFFFGLPLRYADQDSVAIGAQRARLVGASAKGYSCVSLCTSFRNAEPVRDKRATQWEKAHGAKHRSRTSKDRGSGFIR